MMRINFSKKLLIWLLALGLVPASVCLIVSWTYVAVVWQPTAGQQATGDVNKELSRRQKALQASYFWAGIALLGGTVLVALLGSFVLVRTLSARLLVMRSNIRIAAPEIFGTSSSPAHESTPLEALQEDIVQLLHQFQEYQQNEVFKEQVARWQDVARRLAHEIRNPLTPILLCIQDLHRRYDGGNPAYQKQLDSSLEIVKDEVETLRRLVEEFSSFAKLPQIRPQPENLSLVVQEFLDAYNWFRGETQVTFESHLAEAWTSLDKMMFRRVLHNLMKNAIEAGSSSVHLRIGRLGERQVICQIEDRGPGIPAHLQSKIFTPYFTTKQFGTGLGLSITKKIVIDHGGAISLAPHPEGGSIFTIRLTTSPKPPTTERLIT